MEVRTMTAKEGKGKFVIYLLGDIHEGSANMDTQALERAVKIIKEDGDIWFGLGDYVDCINHHDKRFNPKEIGRDYAVADLANLSDVQTSNLASKLKPIADKCRGLLYGNHELKYRRDNTFDVVERLANLLGTEPIGSKAWIGLRFKTTSTASLMYNLVMVHGSGGGGMREGYPSNKVFDVFRWDRADFYAMGHLHRGAVVRAGYSVMQNNAIRKDTAWYGVNGCFMTKAELGTEGYFEDKAGMESTIGMLRIEIDTTNASSHKAEAKTKMELVYL